MRLLWIGLFWILTACAQSSALLAPDIAQPVTRPARNFTSFDSALRCMDSLLATRSRPTIQLSSTGIADHTRQINVAGDDMLINALVRMTERSRSYVFLDQGLVSAQGLIDLLVVQKTETPRPDFYVRGAISQLDSNVSVNNASLKVDALGDSAEPGLDRAQITNKNELSVVSVDLHLVGYPSRQVVPGASVANSMVVRERARGVSSYGVISLTGLDGSLTITRIESTGQAVRNLIEVSLIELIGKHARVPYWTCLSEPQTDATANSTAERGFLVMTPQKRVQIAQDALRSLGFLNAQSSGMIDLDTRSALARFQAQERLLVNGIVDFDTFARLQFRVAEAKRGEPKMIPPTSVTIPSKTTPLTSKRSPPNSNSAASLAPDSTLRDLLPPSLQRTERRDRGSAGFEALGTFLPEE